MQNIRATIESILESVSGGWKRGNYRKSYIYSRKALGIIGSADVDPETAQEVLLYSARSAYYISRFDECEESLTRIEELLERSDGPTSVSAIGEISILRANILRRKGLYAEAIDCLDDAGLVKENLEPVQIIKRLMIRGMCRNRLGNREEATIILEEALGLATHNSDERARAAVLSSIGLLYLSRGFLSRSRDYFKRAVKLYGETADRYGRAASLLNLGIVKGRLGSFAEAEDDIGKAAEGFTESGWEIGLCRSHLALGNVQRYRAYPDKAAQLYERARKIAASRGYLRENALGMSYLGRVSFMLEEYGEAEEMLLKAAELARDVSPGRDIEIQNYRYLADIYLISGEEEKAERYFRKALELAKRFKAEREEGLAYSGLARTAFIRNERDRGADLFERSAELLRKGGCRLDLVKTQLDYAQRLLEEEERDSAGGEEAEIALRSADKLWRMLIESEHLLSGTEAERLKQENRNHLEKVYALLRKMPKVSGGDADGAFVELSCPSEFMEHGKIVAVSRSMGDVCAQAEFAAKIPSPVLITGETGTGKELVARLIHNLGDRSANKFVAVNCSAIPDRLFESELFGHKKGCFTGASSDRKGLFEEASGGSIFLDEIGELTEAQQAKLLRVLQEKKIRRVGENIEREIDVRLISATNKDLDSGFGESSMREDFFYRINEERIHISPLRERREDIVPLLAHFLSDNGNAGRGKIRIEREALKLIQNYSWPGNVREFISVVRRMGRISRGGMITVELLPEKVRGGNRRNRIAGSRLKVNGGTGERKKTLLKLLKSCNGNKTAVARWLGISRGTLYKELKRAGLDDLIG